MKHLLSALLAALILTSCGSDQEINDSKIFLNFYSLNQIQYQ